jgi:hypothetical protein
VLTVSGSHAYSTAGKFYIDLTVTNAAGQSTDVGTTATVSSAANLQVTGGQNVKIAATDKSAAYSFDIKAVSGGVQLSGTSGTTFNGATTLFIANAKSISAQLGSGNDTVRVIGTGIDLTLAMGAGQNAVRFQKLTGGKVQVTSSGALDLLAANSTMSSLSVTGGASADQFRARNLHVTGNTQLALAGGANVVRINDSHFSKNFTLNSSGSGTIVRIEAGKSDGTGTQFDGNVNMQLGGGAQLYFSQNSDSDQTTFGGNLTINAGSPNAKWHRQNVTFAHKPKLTHVDIV